jgi:hypothetical protein
MNKLIMEADLANCRGVIKGVHDLLWNIQNGNVTDYSKPMIALAIRDCVHALGNAPAKGETVTQTVGQLQVMMAKDAVMLAETAEALVKAETRAESLAQRLAKSKQRFKSLTGRLNEEKVASRVSQAYLHKVSTMYLEEYQDGLTYVELQEQVEKACETDLEVIKDTFYL